MAKTRSSTKSIINVLGLIEYEGEEMVNIFKKFSISEGKLGNVEFFDEYIVEYRDDWDSLSFKFYNNHNLWWLLAKYNNIIDPFAELVVGEKIKIIKPVLVSSLVLSLRDI